MMNNLTSYLLGVVAGAVLVIASGLFFDFYPHKIFQTNPLHTEHTNTVLSVEAANGRIPDFTVVPDPVNVYDYVDSTWTVIGPDQQELAFHSLKGRILFMSRWATWCGPCISEMPDIAELRAQLHEHNVVFMLYTDEQEFIVRSFENEHNLPIFTSVGYLPGFLDPGVLPETMIIDTSGTLRYRHTGPAKWGDPSVVAFINELAGTP